jgi:hypothetical protein
MSPSQFISCTIIGGLGNQLFQIFATISYSIRHNITVIFPYTFQLDHKRYTYWDSFLTNLSTFTTLNDEWNISNNHISNLSTFKENNFHYNEIPKVDFSFKLLGYFQSYKYFVNEQENIYRLIKLREQQTHIFNEFSHIFNQIEKTTLISLHFRIGDYITLQENHPIMNLNYYRKSIDYILSFLSSTNKIKILYFCERVDNEKVVKNIEVLQHTYKEENIEFVKVNDDIPDWKQLLIMSICNHNIIANSTFSWWGAYLNINVDKIICYPSVWFGINLKHHIVSDLFPDTWKKIDC